jgi:hypothetical protein
MNEKERRQDPRYRAQDFAFAVFRAHVSKLGQIMDISRSGLAFRYIAAKEWSNGLFEIDIFLADNGFYLYNLSVRTISDFEIANETALSSVAMRRRGMQFVELNQSQTYQLDYFIQNHTVGEV